MTYIPPPEWITYGLIPLNISTIVEIDANI